MSLPLYIPEADAVLFEGTELPDKKSLATNGGRLPELNEWGTYYLKFYGEVPVDFSGKHFNRLPGNQFEINFKNFVGHSRILGTDVRVKSLKICEETYDRMLYEITDRYASLIFSFDTPTGATYEKIRTGPDHAYVEFLFMKHFLVDRSPNLDAVMGLILSNPHHRLVEEKEMVDVDRARFLTPADIVATASNAENYGRISECQPLSATSFAKMLRQKTGQAFYLNRVHQTRKHVTHDTLENRFVKFFLSRLIERVEGFVRTFGEFSGTLLNPSIHTAAVELLQKLSHFRSAPLWQEVGHIESIPESSTVLQGRSGYCDFFRLYSLLQLATRYRSMGQGFRDLIETKDLPLLYEYWCLFQTMDAVQSEMGAPVEVREVTEMGLHERSVNTGLLIRYREQVLLHFNLKCSARGDADHTSYSHPLRPDIVVSQQKRKVIFDAKAKGKRDAFWGEEADGQIGKYKDEDIDKMHTYREAVNDVFGAYILYPGTTTNFFPYPTGRSEFEGVGAIALKPGDSKSGVEQIRKAISAFLLN